MKLFTSSVSHETKHKLEAYAKILIEWNKTHNLIRCLDKEQLFSRHIADGVFLAKYIDMNKRIADLGSGNGIPGIVLAILGAPNLFLVERSKKKAAFLSYASGELNLGCTVLNCDYRLINQRFDILVSRGLDTVTNTINGGYKLGDKFALIKGPLVREEIEEARKFWQFKVKYHGSGKRQVVVIDGVKKTCST